MSDLLCTNHPGVSGQIVRCARCFRPFCPDCVVTVSGASYCGDCKVQQLRDVESGVPTSGLPLAGIWPRFAALMIDQFILTIPFVILIVGTVFVTTGFGDAPPKNEDAALLGCSFAIEILAFLVVFLLYEPLMTARDGQTLGKKAMGIRIVMADGRPMTTGQAWGRSLIRMVIAMVSPLVDDLPACFTAEKTALHDMVIGTRVIRIQ